MTLLDMFGVPTEVGTPILYFRGTANRGYMPRLGYVAGIESRVLIKDLTGRESKMYTPMFIVPSALDEGAQGEQIGHDHWGTPLCIGDQIIATTKFYFYKSKGWYGHQNTRHVLVVSTITGFDRGQIRSDITALYRLTRESNTTPLYLRKYGTEKLFVSEEQTPDFEIGYGTTQDATKGFYSCSKVVALKNAPHLRNVLIKAKLNSK